MAEGDVDIKIRCQRCGAQMDLRDPAPGTAWRPDQFWVCPTCGRHFWTTYATPGRETPKPAAPAAPAAPSPATPTAPAAPAVG